MKTTNIIVLVLLLMSFGPAFVEPDFWKDGWMAASVIGVLLVPGTFLAASYFGPRMAPWMLAASYNGIAALVLVWHAVTIGASDRRDRFVLKGAMLLRLWSDSPYRATRDLDLSRRGDGAFEAIRKDLREIATTVVPPDAVSFDGERVGVEAIRAEDEYAGTRATLSARCGKARLTLQIDMELGDAVWPAPQNCI